MDSDDEDVARHCVRSRSVITSAARAFALSRGSTRSRR
jgi:hypothetical protein